MLKSSLRLSCRPVEEQPLTQLPPSVWWSELGGGGWPADSGGCSECPFSVNLTYSCPPKLQLLSKTPAPPKTFPVSQLVVDPAAALSLLSTFINSWEAVCFIRLTLDTTGSPQIYMLTEDLILPSMVDTLSGTTPLFLVPCPESCCLPVIRCSTSWQRTTSILLLWPCVNKKRQSCQSGLAWGEWKQTSRAFEERGSPARRFTYGGQAWKVSLFHGTIRIFTFS